MTYFFNPFDKIVVQENEDFIEVLFNETSDFEKISKQHALKLIDLQDEGGSWVYWNKTDLKRFDERPFDNDVFLNCLKDSVAVFTNSVGSSVKIDKPYLINSLKNRSIEKCVYKFHNGSLILFIESLVLAN